MGILKESKQLVIIDFYLVLILKIFGKVVGNADKPEKHLKPATSTIWNFFLKSK